MSSAVRQNNEIPPKIPVVLPNRLPPPNPLLFELGNKKKAGLAHEFGAGAACFNCKDGCPGLDLHYWRKICKNCKCRKEDHNIPREDLDPGLMRIGKLLDRSPRSVEDEAAFTVTNNISAGEPNANSMSNSEKKKFDWIPPNTTAKLVDKFMNMLPMEARPIADTEGAALRRLALERQLPLHDYDSTACHELTAEEEKCMQKFVDHFKREVVGQGVVQEKIPTVGETKLGHQNEPTSVWKCFKCQKSMFGGEVAVFAERAGPDVCWHPSCFVCCQCGELLADLIYFYKDNKIYCGRHFGNSIFPRCEACDELIFAKEYTIAEDRPWHLKHFCCFSCDKELGGHRYMFKEGQPYCLDCYKRIFARTCQTCSGKIDADVNRISHQDLHWHATAECFYCCCCKCSLVQQRFVLKQGKIFCSVECKKKILG